MSARVAHRSVLLGHAGMSEGCGSGIRCQARGALLWPRLGRQQLGRERLPGLDERGPDRIVRTLRDCPEPVEALTEITQEPVGLTESLRSARGLAAAKHFQPSF